MLKKLKNWIMTFGFSFLVSFLGLAEQQKAFLYINLGVSIAQILGLVVILILAGLAIDCAAEANGISFLVVLFMAIVTLVTLFFAWVISKIFNINFYLAYEIMTFISCFFNNKND